MPTTILRTTKRLKKNKNLRKNGHLKNGNGHLQGKLVDWEAIPYKEMVVKIREILGPRPPAPIDLPGPEWSEQAVKVLKERYFLKDEEGVPAETTQEMCWRVAWESASSEVKFGKNREEITDIARQYYEMMIGRLFLPNSPTLMNAGKDNGLQYSACYVLPVDDSLVGIFDGVKYQAIVHQSGGGTGFSFSRLRPKGSVVKSSMGVASGPVSFMRIYNEATQQIKQGGMRRGANMGILRVDHPDIMDFIHCKEDGGITNFNISVAATDEFMDALVKDGEYELKDPRSGRVVGKLSARVVWEEIAKGAWATGDPGMIFLDRINKSTANPIRKDGWLIESTNPCGEQPLYPFDACNLGSIFLGYFVKNKKIDWEKLKDVTHKAVRLLDSVIEMNPFPLPQIAETVKNIRRIGLGVGGWADMLVQLEIPYNTDEALHLAEKVMKFINEEGHEASHQLALERGPFPMWKDSIYAKGKLIRNSTVTTIAPTGSIGILANASGGIEPLFAISYQHIVKSEGRTLNFVNPIFEKLAIEKGFYSEELEKKISETGTIGEITEIPQEIRKVFVTAHEIDPEWHVRMQAAFQKYTDNAVSKTINLRSDATTDDIKKAYLLAWETECRGITVFRDGSKGDQVLNLGVKPDSPVDVAKQAQVILERPLKVEGATYKIATPLGTAFITVNQDTEGNPFEVFITIGKAGSEVAAMAEALGRMISTTLRFGNHLPARERAREIVEQLRNIGGGRSVGFGPNKVRSLPDAVAKALSLHFGFNGENHAESLSNLQAGAVMAAYSAPPQGEALLSDPTPAPADFESKHADICPSCGASALVYEEGCAKCHVCGHSEC